MQIYLFERLLVKLEKTSKSYFLLTLKPNSSENFTAKYDLAFLNTKLNI